MLVFMSLLNENHVSSKKDTPCSILFSSRSKAVSQNFALYCILFIYIALLIWEIFCKSDSFSTTNTYLAQVLQMNTFYCIENIFHTTWHVGVQNILHHLQPFNLCNEAQISLCSGNKLKIRPVLTWPFPICRHY